MPRRSFWIACNQVVAFGGQRCVLGFDLAQFFFGAQIDRAEPLALAPQPFERCFDFGDLRYLFARLDARRVRQDLSGSISSMSWISRPMSPSRRLAPSKRSSARPAPRARRLPLLSAARASRSAAASAFSASCRRSAQARRAASAFSTSPIMPAALRGENLRRVFQFGAVALGLGDALIERCDLALCSARGARSSRPCRRRAIDSRLSAISASRTIACCSALHFGEVRRACRRYRRARSASLASRSAAGARLPNARSASALLFAASSRLAVRRLRASASAESRAA